MRHAANATVNSRTGALHAPANGRIQICERPRARKIDAGPSARAMQMAVLEPWKHGFAVQIHDSSRVAGIFPDFGVGPYR